MPKQFILLLVPNTGPMHTARVTGHTILYATCLYVFCNFENPQIDSDMLLRLLELLWRNGSALDFYYDRECQEIQRLWVRAPPRVQIFAFFFSLVHSETLLCTYLYREMDHFTH